LALIIASGYANSYGGDAAEIAAADPKNKQWYPTTIDYRATAARSGGTGEAKSLGEVIALIAAEKPGAIQRLGLVGHANQTVFAMAGAVTMNPSNVRFFESGRIDADSLSANSDKIKAVRDRFAKDARIVLYACNAGVGKDLLDAVSNAFAVCALGFSNEIVWCFTHNGRKIVTRGRTYYDANGLEVYPECDGNSFASDITAWGPDGKSCVGVPSTP
jgi:hypothetical protein